MEEQLNKGDSTVKTININNLIEQALQSVTNLGRLYTEGQIHTKRSIIGSIFPENLEFNGKSYRTIRMNIVAHRIFQINNELRQNKNRKNDCNNHFSCLVAETEQISKHFLEDLKLLIDIDVKIFL